MTVLQGEGPRSPLPFACCLSWTEVAKPTNSYLHGFLCSGGGVVCVLILLWILLFKNTFLGSPFCGLVVRTPRFHCRGQRVDI